MAEVHRMVAPNPWYAEGLRFSCTQCGNCCGGAPGHVWVSPDETRRIAEYIGMDFEQFTRRHVRRVGTRLSLLEESNGDCQWLERLPDGKSRCSINPVKPVQCQTWPFWQENLATRTSWEFSGRSCPGINHGPNHPLPVIQAALKRNADADLPL